MTARYLSAFDRIRETLDARRQSEPLLEAEEIQVLLGGWPSIRTIQRYIELIRGDAIVAERQLSRRRVDTLKPDENEHAEDNRPCLIE